MLQYALSKLNYLLIICVIWTVNAAAAVDIALSVAANPAVVVVNRTTFVSAEVFNFGDEIATDVTVTVTLPAAVSLVEATTTLGQCSGNPTVACVLGDLPSGTLVKQATISVEVTVNQSGSINHEFSLLTSAAETQLTNNSDTATIESVDIGESADLGASFGLMPNNAFQAVLFTAPLSVLNYGPQAVSDVVVEFSVPGLTLADLESASPSQGTCETGLTNCIGLSCVAALQSILKVRCEPGPLASGQQANVDVNFYASSNVGESLRLFVDVHDGSRADPDINNNSISQQIETIAAPDFEVPSGAPSACFIATAAFGSEMHDDVILLRQFRDNQLLKSQWGRLVVDIYYRHSPSLAEVIREDSQYRLFARVLLKPIIWFIKYPSQVMMLMLVFVVIFLRGRFICTKKR